jgi:hypothetical protein
MRVVVEERAVIDEFRSLSAGLAVDYPKGNLEPASARANHVSGE